MPVAPVGLVVLASLAALGPDPTRGGGADLRAPSVRGAPLLDAASSARPGESFAEAIDDADRVTLLEASLYRPVSTVDLDTTAAEGLRQVGELSGSDARRLMDTIRPALARARPTIPRLMCTWLMLVHSARQDRSYLCQWLPGSDLIVVRSTRSAALPGAGGWPPGDLRTERLTVALDGRDLPVVASCLDAATRGRLVHLAHRLPSARAARLRRGRNLVLAVSLLVGLLAAAVWWRRGVVARRG